MNHPVSSVPTISTTEKGRNGEDYVCRHLENRGIRIIARNYRTRFAEIDIIAADGDTLCFIEVRTRNDTRLGHPSETVNEKKQRAVRRAAEAYLAKKAPRPLPIRFDVATVVWQPFEFLYFPNAF